MQRSWMDKNTLRSFRRSWYVKKFKYVDEVLIQISWFLSHTRKGKLKSNSDTLSEKKTDKYSDPCLYFTVLGGTNLGFIQKSNSNKTVQTKEKSGLILLVQVVQLQASPWKVLINSYISAWTIVEKYVSFNFFTFRFCVACLISQPFPHSLTIWRTLRSE